LKPGNANVLTDLEIMYRRSGQPDKAIIIFDKAITADSKNENSRLNKGTVQMHDLNDRNGALRTWEDLLEANPLAMASKNQSIAQMLKHYKEGHDKDVSN